jgi:two-component system CheB/CheR fusion protein
VVKKDLTIPIATGIQKALKGNSEIILTNIRIREKDTLRTFRLQFKQLPKKSNQEKLVAVLLSETVESSNFVESEALTYDVNLDARQRIADLEHELQFTRENLQATVEELETSNEELQATNEELLASNEELQSTNEELQSVNEELYTVNAEHQGKITELTLLNNDLDNLFNSTNIATLFLDENLDIRRYTPRLQVIFHILESDLGRPFFHLTHSINLANLLEIVEGVNNTHKNFDQEIQLTNGHWYLLRIIPYAISPRVSAGVILTFIDIHQLKTTQLELYRREQQETLRLATFVQFSNDAIFLLELDGTIITWNRAAEELYGWTQQEALQMNFHNLIPDEEKSYSQQRIETLKDQKNLLFFQAKRLNKSGQVITVLASACIFNPENSARELIALTERDFLHLHQEEKNDCVNCLQKLASMVMESTEATILFNTDGKIVAWNNGAESLYGWASSDAVTMSCYDIAPEEERDLIPQLINDLLVGKTPKPIKIKRLTKENKIINVQMRATLLGNQLGEGLLIILNESAI